MTAQEIAAVREYLYLRWIGLEITPSLINASAATFISESWGSPATTVQRHSSQAVVRFRATSTSHRIRCVTTAVNDTNGCWDFAVYQDGAYLSSFSLTYSSVIPAQEVTITGLTPGSVIDIYEPGQGPVAVTPGSAINGGYVLTVYGAQPYRVPVSRQIVIGPAGNSYMGGYGAPVPNCRYSLAAHLRAVHPEGAPAVSVRQWSSNGWLVFSDGSHETAAQQAQAAIDLCRGTGSNEVLMVAMERNDWFYNSGTPTQVATRCGAVCDLIVASVPAVKILIACVWPTLSEGANAGGFTLPQYRTAILGVASGRSSFVTTRDLTDVSLAFNTGTMLFDDSHLNETGEDWLSVTGIRPVLPLGPL